MFRRNLFSLVILLALMLVPLGALAQDSEQEMETFTSEDGLLTFSYPAEWFVMSLSESEMSGPPFPFVIFSPSQETLDRLAMDEDFTEGEQAGAVVILPTEFFSVVGEVLPEEPTVGDYAHVAALLLFSEPAEGDMGGEMEGEMAEPTEEEAEAEGEMAEPTEEPTEAAEGEMAEPTEEAAMGESTISEPEEVQLSDSLTGGRVTVTSDVEEVAVLAHPLSEDLIAVTVVGGAPGALTDELLQIGQDVAASIQFTGTADAIMEMLMAPPPDVMVEPSDVDPATLDGNALIDERCTVCHTRERIDMQDKDEAGWTQTVDRMISYGAQLDEAERQAVINYLVETH